MPPQSSVGATAGSGMSSPEPISGELLRYSTLSRRIRDGKDALFKWGNCLEAISMPTSSALSFSLYIIVSRIVGGLLECILESPKIESILRDEILVKIYFQGHSIFIPKSISIEELHILESNSLVDTNSCCLLKLKAIEVQSCKISVTIKDSSGKQCVSANFIYASVGFQCFLSFPQYFIR